MAYRASMASEQPSVITFIWNKSSGTGDFQPTVFRPGPKILANFINGGLTPVGANGILNDLAEIMIIHLRISLQKRVFEFSGGAAVTA